ncbi:aminotransferase class I/II-fold pyridoxal phosphate-dependent enzyme [Halococcus qingdaonensis]|uniref:aminotransferase class I/II-fold pyridoxal phosphate-dependent enzyme n=1 Tax=Halococcus qingdaonensis TaxID=224402 RepID=UPI0021162C69|nr:aminotransferase class I/II-fold pyridoxal phosphate-dependent enzyme [Halococcus qingdaonensis]
MRIEPFELERWFGKYEHDADIMLAESGIRSLPAARFDTDPGDLGYVIPTDGDPDFRAEIAARYGRSADEVVFTCGTQEANLLAMLATLDDGDHAVVVTPTYQSLHALPRSIADVSTVELAPPEWTLDPDAVADAIEPNTRLVVVNNPNNPTGKYHSQDTVDALADLAADNDAYLLCDEVYRLLAEDSLPPVASLGPRGISTTSLTKAHGLAGLRFGWLAGPPEIVDAARRWKDYTTISPSIFGQHVARQALAEEESILDENRALAQEHRERVGEFLAAYGLDWHEPVGVNAFPTIPEGFDDSREFCRTVVEEESVVLAPGDLFGFDDRFRLGFGLPTDELEDGLERVGRVVENAR